MNTNHLNEYLCHFFMLTINVLKLCTRCFEEKTNRTFSNTY